MMYEGFAAVYDALMADVDYGRWAGFYLQLARANGVACLRAADCACGTGNMTLALASQGIAMIGLDLSIEMLRVAGEKARRRGTAVPFIQQDMRKLLLHRPMDAIFCACDGVNYLLTPEDVQAFFSAAYRALRPGGGLFFDISTQNKLENTLGHRCIGHDGLDISYIWQNHYDPKARTLQMDLTFFLQERDGRYRRIDETHCQRAHGVDELTGWLMDCGFTGVRTFGDRVLNPPGTFDERAHLAAIRPE